MKSRPHAAVISRMEDHFRKLYSSTQVQTKTKHMNIVLFQDKLGNIDLAAKSKTFVRLFLSTNCDYVALVYQTSTGDIKQKC
jgi:hypothetical protein